MEHINLFADGSTVIANIVVVVTSVLAYRLAKKSANSNNTDDKDKR